MNAEVKDRVILVLLSMGTLLLVGGLVASYVSSFQPEKDPWNRVVAWVGVIDTPLLTIGVLSVATATILLYTARTWNTPRTSDGKSSASHNDTMLFNELLDVLPPRKAEYFDQHDFGGSFNREDIEPLFRFVNEWNDSEHVFSDDGLEKGRKRLLKAAERLTRAITRNTVSSGNGSLSVMPDFVIGKERPSWVKRSAKEINDAADNFCATYGEMMKAGLPGYRF